MQDCFAFVVGKLEVDEEVGSYQAHILTVRGVECRIVGKKENMYPIKTCLFDWISLGGGLDGNDQSEV